MELTERTNNNYPGQKKSGDLIYIIVTGIFFFVLFIVFVFFPRPTYSELEKRDLTGFPDYKDYRDQPTGYTSGISDWFSDTQPFRDHFLTLSMGLRNAMKLNVRSDENAVSFIATADNMEETQSLNSGDNEGITEEKSLADENAKVANAGIIIMGNPPNVRAMMAFGGGSESGGQFISTVNNYSAAFPNQNIYAVVASSPGEFYMPEKVASRNRPETPTLNHIRESLSPGVKYVDVHSALEAHKNEDIFLRTDHHWAPLGAFYAAEAFAKRAGVPFKPLDSYERKVVHRYIGSMYGYSKDISVKNSPEDFVYYTPKGLDYKTTYITYTIDEDFRITGQTKPYTGTFFKSYKDGSGGAYCTFMGGDQSLVHVVTGTPSSRKLLIIKDSFGNAVPGYLFYSFSDIHVVDFRYFNKNMKKYVAENGITDIAFVFNIFNVCNGSTFRKVNKFLTQNDGEIYKPAPVAEKKEPQEIKAEPSSESNVKEPEQPEPTTETTKASSSETGSAIPTSPSNSNSTTPESEQ